jgi:hypothetical protein
MAHRGEIGSRAARGFNASAHVAKETIRPYRDSIFIGQTLQVPSTVVAQGDLGGITVLAAFANPGMSLSRHLTGVVRPWLSANCHWALTDRRLLLGTFEDADPEAQWSFIQILESVLGDFAVIIAGPEACSRTAQALGESYAGSNH